MEEKYLLVQSLKRQIQEIKKQQEIITDSMDLYALDCEIDDLRERIKEIQTWVQW